MKCKICNKEIKLAKGLIDHEKKCTFISSKKQEIIKLYIEEKLSFRDLQKKFKLQSNDIKNVIGDNVRNKSEARFIASKKYPLKHKEKTKKKLRDIRLKFMKDNPNETAWRKANLSYPEKLFLNKIIELKWYEKYRIEREYPVHPYFVDFAFLNEMVAIEIDGSQHLLPERVSSDMDKDKLLISLGWSVIRITENEVKTNINNLIEKLEKIVNSKIKVEKMNFGIFKYKSKKKIKIKPRNENGLTEKQILSSLKQRKVVRPTMEEILKEVEKTGYACTGRKYGVSDNAIRKWLKYYGVELPKK